MLPSGPPREGEGGGGAEGLLTPGPIVKHGARATRLVTFLCVCLCVIVFIIAQAQSNCMCSEPNRLYNSCTVYNFVKFIF